MNKKALYLLCSSFLLLSACQGQGNIVSSSSLNSNTAVRTTYVTSGPKASSKIYTGTKRDDLDNFFIRSSGWNGADGVYTFAFGNKLLWYFSDTFVGEVDSTRTRQNNKMINNSYAVSDLDGSDIVFHYGEDPIASAFPAPAGSLYWPEDSYVDGNDLYMFDLKMKAGGGLGDILGVDIVKATFDGTLLTQGEITEVPGLQTNDTSVGSYVFGSYVEKGDDGYLYVFGYLTKSGRHNMCVSRMKLDGFPKSQVEYLNNDGWSASPTDLKEMANDISPEFRLYHVGNKVFLAYILSTWSGKIFLSEADTSLSVFPRGEYVYYCPEEVTITKNTFCYNAKIQPALCDEKKIVISYHVNSFTSADNSNAEVYRPRFIEVVRTDGGNLT
jgi:hypothetical protein